MTFVINWLSFRIVATFMLFTRNSANLSKLFSKTNEIYNQTHKFQSQTNWQRPHKQPINQNALPESDIQHAHSKSHKHFKMCKCNSIALTWKYHKLSPQNCPQHQRDSYTQTVHHYRTNVWTVSTHPTTQPWTSVCLIKFSENMFATATQIARVVVVGVLKINTHDTRTTHNASWARTYLHVTPPTSPTPNENLKRFSKYEP